MTKKKDATIKNLTELVQAQMSEVSTQTPEEKEAMVMKILQEVRGAINPDDLNEIAENNRKKKELAQAQAEKAKKALSSVKDAKWVADVTIKQIVVNGDEATELETLTERIELLDAQQAFTKGTTAIDRLYTEEEKTMKLNIDKQGDERLYKKEQNLVDKRAFNHIAPSKLQDGLETSISINVVTMEAGYLQLMRIPAAHKDYLEGKTQEEQVRKDATHSSKAKRDAFKNKLQQEAQR